MQKKMFFIVYKLDPKTKYRLIFHLKLLLLIDINSVRINYYTTYSGCFCGLTSDIYTSQHMINRCKGYSFPAPYLSIKNRHLCKIILGSLQFYAMSPIYSAAKLEGKHWEDTEVLLQWHIFISKHPTKSHLRVCLWLTASIFKAIF